MKIRDFLPFYGQAQYNKNRHEYMYSLPREYHPIAELLYKNGFEFTPQPEEHIDESIPQHLRSLFKVQFGFFIKKHMGIRSKVLAVQLPVTYDWPGRRGWNTFGYITVDNRTRDRYSLENKGKEGDIGLLREIIDRYIRA